MTKLSIEVSEKEHREIKALAALNGQSIREFVLARVFEADLGKPGHQITLDALSELRAGKNTLRYSDVDSLMDDIWKD